jgi:hypothetical protein
MLRRRIVSCVMVCAMLFCCACFAESALDALDAQLGVPAAEEEEEQAQAETEDAAEESASVNPLWGLLAVAAPALITAGAYKFTRRRA